MARVLGKGPSPFIELLNKIVKKNTEYYDMRTESIDDYGKRTDDFALEEILKSARKLASHWLVDLDFSIDEIMEGLGEEVTNLSLATVDALNGSDWSLELSAFINRGILIKDTTIYHAEAETGIVRDVANFEDPIHPSRTYWEQNEGRLTPYSVIMPVFQEIVMQYLSVHEDPIVKYMTRPQWALSKSKSGNVLKGNLRFQIEIYETVNFSKIQETIREAVADLERLIEG